MTIHTTGSNGLTLFLDVEDLCQMGLEKERLDEPAARMLVRETLQRMGMSAGLLEISAFVGKGGAMVVALLEDSSPHSWVFYQTPEPDALLDIWQLTESATCRFYRLRDIYYIAICEQAATQAMLACMTEFGVRLYRPQSFLAYLEEHAKKIG